MALELKNPGVYYLYKHIPAGADPLGPDNILGLVSGLLTDLVGRYCLGESLAGLVRVKAMEDGARGMSTGLEYVPSIWSDVDEVVALSYHRVLIRTARHCCLQLNG